MEGSLPGLLPSHGCRQGAIPQQSLSHSDHRYELRCIIWKTADVDLQDVSLSTKMSNIYVKG